MQCDEQPSSSTRRGDRDGRSGQFHLRHAGYQAPRDRDERAGLRQRYTVDRTYTCGARDVMFRSENGRPRRPTAGARGISAGSCPARVTASAIRWPPIPTTSGVSSMEELADQLTGVLHRDRRRRSRGKRCRDDRHCSVQKRAVRHWSRRPWTRNHVIVALPALVVDPTPVPPARDDERYRRSQLGRLRTGRDRRRQILLEVSLRLVRASFEMGDPTLHGNGSPNSIR